MDWSLMLLYTLRLTGAFLLALPIGWERERSSKSAGLRTFPLVATASCAYVLIGATLPGGTADAYARVLQGLITGIGFIGGGAILKSSDRVRGTATAASVWMTGAIGAAVGFGRWEMAIPVAALTMLALRYLTKVERRIDADARRDGVVEDDAL